MAESIRQHGKVLKMSLVCAICLQKLKNPKCLPCLHTFCQACLNNHIKTTIDENKKTQNMVGIHCPVCRGVAYAPKPGLKVEDWAANYPINHLVNTLMELIPANNEIEFCDPCKESDRSKVALHFCQNCTEALCDDCSRCHKSMKATKDHVVEPLEEVRGNPKNVMKDTDKCTEHSDGKLEMYCKDHEKPCCIHCVASKHRKCSKVYPIGHVMEETKEKPEQEIDPIQLVKDLEALINESDKVKKERQASQQSTQAQGNQILQKVASTKEQIIKHVEKMETAILTRFNAVHKVEIQQMEDQITFCNNLKSTTEHLKAMITALEKQGKKDQKFIILHQGKSKLGEYTAGLKKVQENAAIVSYVYKEDDSVSKALQILNDIGNFKMKKSLPGRSATPSPPPTPLLPPVPSKEHTVFVPDKIEKVKTSSKKVIKDRNFNAKIKNDGNNCLITALKIWDDDRVFLADNANKKLKLFASRGQLACSVSCQYAPWDFDFMDKNKCAVTFPNERRIKFFIVTDTVTPAGFIITEKGCIGICKALDHLIVSFNSGAVKVITQGGEVKMSIKANRFSKPEFLAFNTKSNKIYVSDYNNHNVTALKYEHGSILPGSLFVYPISGPKGVTVDSEGNMYVVGYWASTIHKVGEEGNLVKILLDSLKRPLLITFSSNEDRFAVVEETNPNEVKFYKLTNDKVEPE
ncbi:hypothetical protein CHS0354_025200 [Potamilus streckersoni]|uniref:Uncharacterized protein n=1 Tax=Potamilus streckersoni TaxID=2493646 RepID=A0AAE0RN54_9BIVA|nr:hypothetical protein CHS0354_025200 [Potamilus streckersoni]